MVRAIHALRGRARFKVEGLYASSPLKSHLERELSRDDHILRSSASTLTGNVLVHFHPHETLHHIIAIVERTLVDFLEQQESEAIESPDDPRREEAVHRGRLLPGWSKHLTDGSEKAQPLLMDQEIKDWHLMDAESVVDLLQTSRSSGLSHESVIRNIRQYGPNSLLEPRPRSGFRIVSELLECVSMTLVGAVVTASFLMGGPVDALVMMVVVTINGAIGYIVETRAERTLRFLKLKRSLEPRARVVRNGAVGEAPIEKVAVGDVIILSPGAYVPADARLIEANNLTVDESVLTGECMPVRKCVKALTPGDLPLGDRFNMVYRGTQVTGGKGFAVVVATGRFTELGRLHTLVSDLFPPRTMITRHLLRAGRQMVVVGGFACFVSFIPTLLRGFSLTRIIRTSLSVMDAALPEGFSTLAVATLAFSMREMKRHAIFVRHLNALGNLGSIQIMCFDKTGTLTMNSMSVVEIYADMEILEIDEEKSSELFRSRDLLWLVRVLVLCNEVEMDKHDGEVVLRGSSTETALIHLAMGAGFDIEEIRREYPLVEMNFRSEEQPYMTSVHGLPERGRLVAMKGSPLEVLELCGWRRTRDGDKLPLTEEDRHAIELENGRMAGKALRVLGVAYAVGEKEDEVFQTRQQQELIWLGLVGMTDPVRRQSKELVHTLHKAGIKTTILTGDQSPTAYAIGKELSLSGDAPLKILDSTQLAGVPLEAMKAFAQKVHVYARVDPSQKFHIIQAYQRAGKVVAMVGDGINDAPALRASDVGVAMGIIGTESAREAADVVLEDDDLRSLIVAVKEGRTVYENIHKALRYLMAANLSDVTAVVAAAALGAAYEPSAVLSVVKNLLCLTLTLDPPAPDVLDRPPWDSDAPLMSAADHRSTALDTAAIAMGALGAGGCGVLRHGWRPRAGNLASQSLALGQILYSLRCRTNDPGSMNTPMPPNPYLRMTLLGALTLQGASMMIPGLRKLLKIPSVDLLDLLVVGGSALLPFAVDGMVRREKRVEIGEKAFVQHAEAV